MASAIHVTGPRFRATGEAARGRRGPASNGPGGPNSYAARWCPANTSSRPTSSRRSIRPTARFSRTSRCRSSSARRSASSATTAPGNRRCYGSWPAATATSAATRARSRRERRPARAGAAPRPCKTCARTCSRASASWSRSRALQRDRRQLLRRDGGRVRSPAGANRCGGRVEPRRDGRARDGRAALPARRRRRGEPLGRRAASRRALPPATEPAGPAAARRADESPRRGVGRMARAPPRGVQGSCRRGHPRPLLPRQRRRLDPRTRPRSRDPYQGNYSGWLEQKQARLAQ